MTPIGVHLCSSVVSFILLVAAPLLCVLRVPVVKRVPIGFVDSGSGAALYSSGCPRECISYEHAMVCYRSHHRIFASTLLDPERVCVRRRGAGLLRKENPAHPCGKVLPLSQLSIEKSHGRVEAGLHGSAAPRG